MTLLKKGFNFKMNSFLKSLLLQNSVVSRLNHFSYFLMALSLFLSPVCGWGLSGLEFSNEALETLRKNQAFQQVLLFEQGKLSQTQLFQFLKTHRTQLKKIQGLPPVAWPNAISGREKKFKAASRSLRVLLDYGVDPNATIEKGFAVLSDTPIFSTALSVAAVKEDHQAIELLLKFGANPNLRTSSSLSPLALAILTKNKKIGTTLIDAGAKINQRRLDFQTYDHTDFVSILNTLPSDPEVIELALDLGADPTITSEDGSGLYVYAIKSLNPNLAKLAKQKGASLDIKVKYIHETPKNTDHPKTSYKEAYYSLSEFLEIKKKSLSKKFLSQYKKQIKTLEEFFSKNQG